MNGDFNENVLFKRLTSPGKRRFKHVKLEGVCFILWQFMFVCGCEKKEGGVGWGEGEGVEQTAIPDRRFAAVAIRIE